MTIIPHNINKKGFLINLEVMPLRTQNFPTEQSKHALADRGAVWRATCMILFEFTYREIELEVLSPNYIEYLHVYNYLGEYDF